MGRWSRSPLISSFEGFLPSTVILILASPGEEFFCQFRTSRMRATLWGFKTLGRLREEGDLEKFPQIHARYSNDTETCSRVYRNNVELITYKQRILIKITVDLYRPV